MGLKQLWGKHELYEVVHTIEEEGGIIGVTLGKV
jgi:hypothetical protein